MLSPTIQTLVFKDARTLGPLVVTYFLGSIAAVLVNLIPGQTASYLGAVLLLTVFMSFYSHLGIKSTIAELRDKNQLFVMTLPISPRGLFAYRMTVCFATFFAAWFLILSLIVLLITNSDRIPSMSLSLYFFTFLLFIPTYSIIIAMGLIFHREGVSILSFVLSNSITTILISLLSNAPESQKAFQLGTYSEVGFIWPSWSGHLIAIVVATTAVTLGGAIICGIRKSQFDTDLK